MCARCADASRSGQDHSSKSACHRASRVRKASTIGCWLHTLLRQVNLEPLSKIPACDDAEFLASAIQTVQSAGIQQRLEGVRQALEERGQR